MFSFFGLREIFSKEIIDKGKSYKEHASGLAEEIKTNEVKQLKESSVNPEISKKEFSKRYGYGRFTCFCLFIALLGCFYLLLTANSIISLILPIMAGIYILMLYFNFSYELWRARVVAKKWSQRNKSLTTTYSKYINAIRKNTKEIIPIKLEFK